MNIRSGAIAVFGATLLAAAATVPAAADEDPGYSDGSNNLSRHEGPYVTGFIGGALGNEIDFENVFNVDLDSGLLYGGTFGYDGLFSSSMGDIRVEIEGSHRSQDFDGLGGGINLTTLLGNVWYDFDTHGPLVPYAGGGVGAGFIARDVPDDTGLAYQFGGGFNYSLSRHLTAGLNYRFLLGKFQVDQGPGHPHIDYSGHQLSASLGYSF